MNKSNLNLDNCGCCEGVDILTPARIDNDHGLASLLFRVGTHSSFKSSMISILSDAGMLKDLAIEDGDRSSALILKELTTREDNDPTIALIDVWAMILDVLTFYNERIINEGYILTSKERLSLVELAKHISYIPKPGVAAGAWFSFLTDESPGAPKEARVPVGTRVQSIPGQDEKAQIFENLEEITIKTKWNNIRPKLKENQVLTTGSKSVYLEGTNTQLQKGDYLLIVDNDRINTPSDNKWNIRIVDAVVPDNIANYTLVSWQVGIDKPNLLVQTADNNNNAKVYAFRQRASIFGYNAPDYRTMSEEVKESFNGTGWDSDNDWDGFDLAGQFNSLHLDAWYPKIADESWMVLVNATHTELFKVDSVSIVEQTNFALSAKSTQLGLDTSTSSAAGFQRRSTLVLAQSEELTLAQAPLNGNLPRRTFDLGREYPELKVGHKLIISGKLADHHITSPDQATSNSELAEIEELDGLTLKLKNELTYDYQRSSVSINANIAQATHGETKTEILGSGNGAVPFQKFYLKQQPLTYISAASASGIASSLEIRVDDIRWEEVPSFYDRTPDERIFISRMEDDGTVYVQFGNGITGARLPTGVENIRATYRVGIGMEGLLNANQLSLLLSPQLGIKSVTNPVASSGAEGPELFENIRNNAPFTVLTLERVVSIEDFENFANAYPGIGKARAELLWQDEDRTVHITVASADEGAVDDTLMQNLKDAINGARHNNYPLEIQSFSPIFFNVKANLKIQPDYLEENVIAAVEAILLDTYQFKSRSFGQGVAPSEVIAVMQSVDGVIAVDLDELNGYDPFDPANAQHFPLQSKIARWEEDPYAPGEFIFSAAELLLITADNIEITLMES